MKGERSDTERLKVTGKWTRALAGFLVAVMAGALSAGAILVIIMSVLNDPVGVAPSPQALIWTLALVFIFNTSVAMLIALPVTWMLRRYSLEHGFLYAITGAALGVMAAILWMLLINSMLSVSSTEDGIVVFLLLGAFAGAVTGLTWAHLRHRSKD